MAVRRRPIETLTGELSPMDGLFELPKLRRPRSPQDRQYDGEPEASGVFTPVRLSELQEQLGEALMIGLYREADDPEVVAHFTVDGEPETKARPRVNPHTGARPFTPKRTRLAEKQIAWLFKQAAGPFMLDGASGFGVFASFVRATGKRCDVDNMLKLVMDALTGVVWVDDSQITEISAKTRRFGSDPRTDVVIYRTLKQEAKRLTCAQCGKQFLGSASRKRRFCSHACSSLARRTGEQVPCSVCGKPFYRNARDADRGMTRCSLACRRAAGQ